MNKTPTKYSQTKTLYENLAIPRGAGIRLTSMRLFFGALMRKEADKSPSSAETANVPEVGPEASPTADAATTQLVIGSQTTVETTGREEEEEGRKTIDKGGKLAS